MLQELRHNDVADDTGQSAVELHCERTFHVLYVNVRTFLNTLLAMSWLYYLEAEMERFIRQLWREYIRSFQARMRHLDRQIAALQFDSMGIPHQPGGFASFDDFVARYNADQRSGR